MGAEHLRGVDEGVAGEAAPGPDAEFGFFAAERQAGGAAAEFRQKQACGVEHGPLDGHERPDGIADVAGLHALVGAADGPEHLGGEPGRPAGDPVGIDVPGDAEHRVAIRQGFHGIQHAGTRNGVIIEKHDEFALRGGDPGVAGSREAARRGVRNDADIRKGCGDTGEQRRVVIHHDHDLVGGLDLSANRTDRLAQGFKAAIIMAADEDARCQGTARVPDGRVQDVTSFSAALGWRQVRSASA